jgi:type IV pilus assembly protein PilE
MKKAKGFTLLELMIVVVIIAIIAAFAMFNYAKYGYRSRRVDGKEMLARVAAAEERYYTSFNAYTNSMTALGYNAANQCSAAGCSDKGYYLISSVNGATSDNQSYTLTATARAPQDKDACGNLTLDYKNGKGYSGNQSNGNCW